MRFDLKCIAYIDNGLLRPSVAVRYAAVDKRVTEQRQNTWPVIMGDTAFFAAYNPRGMIVKYLLPSVVLLATLGSSACTGPMGPQGNQGNTGYTGDTGAKGNQGNTGNTGYTGAQGETGNQGNTGSTGATGNTGDTGAEGMQGATGATGAKGRAGSGGSTVVVVPPAR